MSRDQRLSFTVIRLIRVLPVALVIVIAAAGNAFSQTPTLSSTPEFANVVKLIREGRNEQVFQDLKARVKSDPLNGNAWYLLGIAYLQHSDFKKASSAFDRTMELEPSLAASTHAQFAYAFVLRNRFKIAEPEASKALEIDRNNIDALYTVAVLDLRLRGRDNALKNADTIIALKPDLAEGYLLRSMVLLGFKGNIISIGQESKPERLQRYQGALEALEQYLKLSNDPRTAQQWQEQLDSLKFYVAYELGHSESSATYFPSEASTKARIIDKPPPSYSETARAEEVAGTVVLRCVFAEDGTIQHVLVLQHLTHGLTEAAIAATKQIKFEPAVMNGKPARTFMQLEYNFNVF